MRENFNIDRYVSELGDDLLRDKNKVILEAPTNSGKTHFVINHCKENHDSFVYYADSLLLAQQVANEYGLTFHSAGNPAPDGSPWISTVYNHYPKFSNGNYNATIEDEFHIYVSDYGYKADVIDNVLLFSAYNDTRFLLSGTVLNVPEGFDHIQIDRKNQPEFKIQVLTDFKSDSENYGTEVLLSEIMDGISAGKQVWVSLFDKSKYLPIYQKMLNNYGITQSEIALINADTKDGDAFQQLVHYRRIDDVKVVFTTFVQGFNIYGNAADYKLIIVPNYKAKHSWADMIQICNRFRHKSGNLEAQILWDGFPRMNNKTIEEIIKQSRYKSFKTFEEEKKVLNKLLSFYSQKKGYFNTKISQWIVDEYRLGLVTADLYINKAKLEFNVHKELTEIMWTDIDIMKGLLATGGITIETIASSFKSFKKLDADEKNLLKKEACEAKIKMNFNALNNLHSLDELSVRSPYYFLIRE